MSTRRAPKLARFWPFGPMKTLRQPKPAYDSTLIQVVLNLNATVKIGFMKKKNSGKKTFGENMYKRKLCLPGKKDLIARIWNRHK